ncbi:hypothetical protein [Streptomyces mirabilis]|uniref:hypothetical protein n=1 Tax=Streptomyces mirabilis TaxID=68239 RepID=UPI003317B4D6
MVDVGYPLSEITRRFGLDRRAVRRYRDTSFDVLLASAATAGTYPLTGSSRIRRPSSPHATPLFHPCSPQDHRVHHATM